FCQLHGYLNELKELDDKILSKQLEQFIVEVSFENTRTINLFDKQQFKNLHRTLDGHMKSIVEKGYKNHKQSNPLETDEIKLLLDSLATSINDPKGFIQWVWLWLSLLCCLRGNNAKHLKASCLKELENSRMQLGLSKEKNNADGIKNPYTIADSSSIPANIPENIYTPVANIKKYLTKRLNNTEDDFFFVTLNTPKKIYLDEWYLPAKLGKESHNTIMYSICKDTKLDFKSNTITNHLMHSIGIHNLVESGHKTIAGISAYKHQSLKYKLDNVFHLIPVEE
ncbi:22969_t:CDS:2, partial [Dentiscutata erythropus]